MLFVDTLAIAGGKLIDKTDQTHLKSVGGAHILMKEMNLYKARGDDPFDSLF